jgi:hypothetical protein
LYFPNLFTIQLNFLLYCPYPITVRHCLSSIFSNSFHYSTYLSSIFSISYHYSTYFSAIFSISFHNFLL